MRDSYSTQRPCVSNVPMHALLVWDGYWGARMMRRSCCYAVRETSTLETTSPAALSCRDDKTSIL
jgi:hypothetical protein